MGPQIAAAIHLAAALGDCPMLEFNPSVFAVANRFLTSPLLMDGAAYALPSGPGLGSGILEDELRARCL
jgi:galactonate dehydratase